MINQCTVLDFQMIIDWRKIVLWIISWLRCSTCLYFYLRFSKICKRPAIWIKLAVRYASLLCFEFEPSSQWKCSQWCDWTVTFLRSCLSTLGIQVLFVHDPELMLCLQRLGVAHIKIIYFLSSSDSSPWLCGIMWEWLYAWLWNKTASKVRQFFNTLVVRILLCYKGCGTVECYVS